MSDKPQTDTDKVIADFLNRRAGLGALDYIRHAINNPAFLKAIDQPNFQPLLQLLVEDHTLIDSNDRVDMARKEYRDADIIRFADFCRQITEHEAYERHLRAAERLSTDTALDPHDRGNLQTLLRGSQCQLINSLNACSLNSYGF